MELREHIAAALKSAMREKDTARLPTLRLISAAIKDRDIAKRGEGGDGADEGVSNDEILQILGKMVKQRHESVRAYEEGGRLELAEQERGEILVIEDFLPKQLDEGETNAAVDAAIAETGATSIRDMGKVMGVLKSKYTGQMDFGTVGPMVKARLG
ncbi:MAG: GatB/YqeY domain-containing protein [Pseudomonadota bacterium]